MARVASAIMGFVLLSGAAGRCMSPISDCPPSGEAPKPTNTHKLTELRSLQRVGIFEGSLCSSSKAGIGFFFPLGIICEIQHWLWSGEEKTPSNSGTFVGLPRGSPSGLPRHCIFMLIHYMKVSKKNSLRYREVFID